jgi:hypothetical protein
MTGKRGRCLHCSHTFALTKAGRLRKHWRRGLGVCPGSGQVPA